MKIKFTLLITISPLLFAFLLSACKYDSKGKMTSLPNVTGSAGEVVVVLEKAAWEESAGKAFTSILKADYPMLPQSEPLFDMFLIPPISFTDIFRSHRNIIITKVGGEYQKPQLILQRDIWATPQIVITIEGATFPIIAEYILKEKERIVQILEQTERDRIVNNATKYEEKGLRLLLEDRFNVSVTFPKGYRLNKDTTDFVWISHETPHTSQAVLVYSYPYTDSKTFTPEYLVQKRNSFVNKLIPGPSAGSFMTTFTEIYPTFNSFQYKNRYFGQLRGLWDVHGHPMGGPFVSLTTVDEARNRVIAIEAYVYAPRFKKRNYLRQVEALIYNITVKE